MERMLAVIVTKGFAFCDRKILNESCTYVGSASEEHLRVGEIFGTKAPLFRLSVKYQCHNFCKIKYVYIVKSSQLIRYLNL